MPGPVARIRVLVVEDDQEASAFLGDALRNHLACELEMASSGEEGRLKLGAATFDLVVCDVRMPGMSGIELLDWARSSGMGIARRFLLVTGDEGGAEICAKAGAGRPVVLRKPFTVQELLQACVGVLRVPAGG